MILGETHFEIIFQLDFHSNKAAATFDKTSSCVRVTRVCPYWTQQSLNNNPFYLPNGHQHSTFGWWSPSRNSVWCPFNVKWAGIPGKLFYLHNVDFLVLGRLSIPENLWALYHIIDTLHVFHQNDANTPLTVDLHVLRDRAGGDQPVPGPPDLRHRHHLHVPRKGTMMLIWRPHDTSL